MAVTTKPTVFRNVMPCIYVERYQRFGKIYCLSPQGMAKMERAVTSSTTQNVGTYLKKKLRYFYAMTIFKQIPSSNYRVQSCKSKYSTVVLLNSQMYIYTKQKLTFPCQPVCTARTFNSSFKGTITLQPMSCTAVTDI
jgi:hypothetical protein